MEAWKLPEADRIQAQQRRASGLSFAEVEALASCIVLESSIKDMDLNNKKELLAVPPRVQYMNPRSLILPHQQLE
jgi:hypothetical protein